MSDIEICKCCERPGHDARKCKARFSARWPGKPAIRLLIRNEAGGFHEIISQLPADLVDQAEALFLAICKAQS